MLANNVFWFFSHFSPKHADTLCPHTRPTSTRHLPKNHNKVGQRMKKKSKKARTLIIQQLLPRLGTILGIGAFHNRIHRAALLAKPAVDTLCHINIVTRSAPAAVGALLGLDRDGLCRADGLAQLAGDAALLARRVAPQRVLATETGRDGALFEGVVDCVAVEKKKKRWWSARCHV